MPNRRLTPSEIASLNDLQDVTVAALKFLAGDDAELLFALRRRLYTRLMHLERGTPMHRTKLKRLKWKAQDGRCAICGKPMEQRGSELARFIRSWGDMLGRVLLECDCQASGQAPTKPWETAKRWGWFSW